MASQSDRQNTQSIFNHQGQAIIELLLIASIVLGAMLVIIEGMQSFEQVSRDYLFSKEIK